MKLYKIEAINGAYDWDCYDGFIIRASSEEAARQIAESKYRRDEPKGFWLDSEHSSIEEVFVDGREEVVLSSYVAG